MSSIQLRPIVAAASINGRAQINGHVQINGHGHSHLQINGHANPTPAPNLRIAFQGAPGAYSEFAAKTLSPNCSTLPCPSLHSSAAAVESNVADRFVLPVESTLSGATLRNYDLLLRRNLHIVAELSLFVDYCLLAIPGVRAAELRRVISHPLALANCGRSLAVMGLDPDPVDDTAGAVEMLLSNRMLDTAAIASPRAASLYGLDVLAQGLQDESWNVTRFLLLASAPIAAPTGALTKTSMVVAHRGGPMVVLLKVLSAFSNRNINLTKLEVINEDPVMILDVNSNTLKAFPHVLYVDFEGSPEDPKAKEAISEIEKVSVFVRILGCYAADPNIYDLH